MNRESLDRYITGNYGEDQFKGSEDDGANDWPEPETCKQCGESGVTKDGLCYECNVGIGIPNVPAIVWEAEQKRAQALLDSGHCPRHPEIELIDDECPVCEDERNMYSYET